jgi:hypothetical protein
MGETPGRSRKLARLSKQLSASELRFSTSLGVVPYLPRSAPNSSPEGLNGQVLAWRWIHHEARFGCGVQCKGTKALLNQQRLEGAIRTKRRISLRYKVDGLERTFEPYLIFRLPDGKLLLGGYELPKARSGAASLWKELAISEIRGLRLSEETFIQVPSFDGANKRYDGNIVYCAPMANNSRHLALRVSHAR